MVERSESASTRSPSRKCTAPLAARRNPRVPPHYGDDDQERNISYSTGATRAPVDAGEGPGAANPRNVSRRRVARKDCGGFACREASMKFTCNTKDIAGAVAAAGKVVNTHTTMPILGNVLLTAKKGRVNVRATDLELTLENGFPAEVSEEGACTVGARLFAGYLANLPAAELEMH